MATHMDHSTFPRTRQLVGGASEECVMGYYPVIDNVISVEVVLGGGGLCREATCLVHPCPQYYI